LIHYDAEYQNPRMRWLLLALLMLSVAAVSSVSGRPRLVDDDGRIRIATFNIHKGADRQERYDLGRTIDAIAALDADVVGVQEVLRNHASFGCDDQPALIARGLRRLTGQTWHYVYERAWLTENEACLRSGRGDETEGEGLAIFSRDRIVASRFLRLSEGRIGLAASIASMPGVSIVVTHLSASRADAAGRASEIARLLPWAHLGGAPLLMGDFNATPDAEELGVVRSRYADAWHVAAGRGATGGIDTGATRPGRRLARIDYIFFDPAIGLALESVDVVDTSSSEYGEVSDHRPVVATFRRRP
jgi:endonuclease/exonuclease/phosphatase family metal-dependent hydrolase